MVLLILLSVKIWDVSDRYEMLVNFTWKVRYKYKVLAHLGTTIFFALLNTTRCNSSHGQQMPISSTWDISAHPSSDPQKPCHKDFLLCWELESRAVVLGYGRLNSVPPSAPGSLWYSGKLRALAKAPFYKLWRRAHLCCLRLMWR